MVRFKAIECVSEAETVFSRGFDYEQSALVAVSVVRDAAELDSFVLSVWGAN